MYTSIWNKPLPGSDMPFSARVNSSDSDKIRNISITSAKITFLVFPNAHEWSFFCMQLRYYDYEPHEIYTLFFITKPLATLLHLALQRYVCLEIKSSVFVSYLKIIDQVFEKLLLDWSLALSDFLKKFYNLLWNSSSHGQFALETRDALKDIR